MYDSNERRCFISPKKITAVRLSDEERRRIEKEAEDLGITISEYLRIKVQGSSQLDRIEKKIDSIDKKVSKPKK
jgi:hypothetical protein